MKQSEKISDGKPQRATNQSNAAKKVLVDKLDISSKYMVFTTKQTNTAIYGLDHIEIP